MSGSAHHKVVGAQHHPLKLHYDHISQVHMAVLSAKIAQHVIFLQLVVKGWLGCLCEYLHGVDPCICVEIKSYSQTLMCTHTNKKSMVVLKHVGLKALPELVKEYDGN